MAGVLRIVLLELEPKVWKKSMRWRRKNVGLWFLWTILSISNFWVPLLVNGSPISTLSEFITFALSETITGILYVLLLLSSL